MKKLLSILLAITMIIAICAGCGSTNTPATDTTPAASSGEKTEGGSSAPAESGDAAPAADAAKVTDLRVGLYAEPATLDPGAVSLSSTNASVETSIYATLFDYECESGTYYPYMATGYEWSDDYMTLTVTIRDDLVSAAGTPIKASDCVFCLTRACSNPSLSNTFQYFVADSWTVVDDTTFTVQMTSMNPGSWGTLALAPAAIYAQADFESVGEEAWARNPIGCGPYKFDHWEAGSEIVLTKNENFWGDEAAFNSITFKFIPDANARTLALQSGDIDFTENIGSSLVPSVQGVDGISLHYSNIGETQVIWFNNLDNEYLKNADVRKALEYATNKEAILYTIYNGSGAVSDSVFTYGSAQYSAPAEDRSYNPEKAKELLAKAGYADGFTIELSCYESTDYANLLAMLKEQWAEIGVTCNITTFDKGAFFEKLYGGQFDAYTIHNVGLDPAIRLINYRSTLTRIDGNLTGFANPEYDECVQNALTAVDTAVRDENCKKAADLLREACPFFSIVDTYLIHASVDGITNVCNGPTSYINYYKMICA